MHISWSKHIGSFLSSANFSIVLPIIPRSSPFLLLELYRSFKIPLSAQTNLFVESYSRIEQPFNTFSYRACYGMAPFLEEPSILPTHINKKDVAALLPSAKNPPSSHLAYEPGRTPIEVHEDYKHYDLRPTFPNVHWPPLIEVPYHDRGHHGDPQFRNLLANATDVFDYNPKIGTEIHGVNLAKLTDAQKDDLARLISLRGVVFFRNQADLNINAQRELGIYFGTLHKHATTSVPRRGDLDDVHVVYTDEKSRDQKAVFAPTFLWHSDVSKAKVTLSY